MILDDFQVFVKPLGARCNLRCSYCYYIDKGDIYGPERMSVMDDETLKNFIKQHFAASTGDTALFTWHGGEPLLAGIDFYEKALFFQQRYLPQGKSFLNGIQTNGTLITNEWCEFLAANGFIVGISMDGPEIFHNAQRHTSNQCGSFEKTLGGYRLLREHGVNAEILCVVNSCNVRHPLVVYDFFKMLGVNYITFLPLVEAYPSPSERVDAAFANSSEGKEMASSSLFNGRCVSAASVPALEFGIFLAAIFDEWLKKDIGIVKIQIFEEALRTAFNQEHSLCIFRERCGCIPVVEHTGDFYPCDHFVKKDKSLGNINEHHLAYFLQHPVQMAFGDAKRNTLPQYCIRCEVKSMCNGECPKNRFITSPDGEQGLNYLCEGYKYFFNHCKPFVDSVSEAWKIDN